MNAHDVDYMIVGGYAVGVHGHPRTTNDLDIWLRASPENSARLAAALQQFGFSKEALPSDLGATPGRVMALGVSPLRIELLTIISGLIFDEAFPRRLVIDVEGVPIHVIGLEDLGRNKKASGRLKDLADLESLGL